jgi:hypothetical protein
MSEKPRFIRRTSRNELVFAVNKYGTFEYFLENQFGERHPIDLEFCNMEVLQIIREDMVQQRQENAMRA